MAYDLIPLTEADRARSLRRYDPFMPPEWRYERILHLVDRSPTPGRVTRRDDSIIRAARRFILRWRAAEPWQRDRLAFKAPALYSAWNIFNRISTDPEVAFMLEARLLANQSFVEIGDALCCDPQVIEWYESLFFNVVPYLRAHDWIMKHVLTPAVDRFAEVKDEEDDDIRRFVTPPVIKPHYDMTLKFFAYFGGPMLVEFMISGFKRGVVCPSQDEIGGWLDEHFNNAGRRRSSQAMGVFEVNKYNVIDLFNVHLRIMELAKGVDGQDERHTMFEKHVNAMLTEIPWVVGSQAQQLFEGTVVGSYDTMAAELRDEELLLVSAGEKPVSIEEVPGLHMPVGKEVDANANAK